MNELDVTDLDVIIKRIRAQAKAENFRITQHAQQEMAEEGFCLMMCLTLSQWARFKKITLTINEERVVW